MIIIYMTFQNPKEVQMKKLLMNIEREKIKKFVFVQLLQWIFFTS